jgi:hypothetical protein
MPVKINSSGGGSVTLSSGSIATDVTATFPATTGNAVVDTAVQTLTNKTLVGAVMTSIASSVLTLGTAQASTSGTSIDFTGIPSWVRRVTVIFNGVSTNGTNNLLVQLGTSSGVDATGYSAVSVGINGTGGGGNASSTAGHLIRAGAAAVTNIGSMVIHNVSGNIWVSNHVINSTDFSVCTFGGGNKTLAGALDRVRITTVGGTDTFDAGTINIVWE